VATVRGYFRRFVARWPDIAALAAAPEADVMAEWAGLGYYARARNLSKCASVVAGDFDGRFPDDMAGLLALPGIGPYTAAAIASIAFDRPEAVMDGNVERVMARLHDLHTPLPTAKPELMTLTRAHTPDTRPGDHAQAMMDLGATICTPSAPACGTCPLSAPCRARAAGTAPLLPRKAPRKPKPRRLGIVYLGQRADGAWLLERRPGKGLLGGMLGWPGAEWRDAGDGPPTEAPPCEADWYPLQGEVRHTFTHFHLILTVHAARLAMDAVPDRGFFIDRRDFSPADLPKVMRKAHDLLQNR
jgi:A/G-specific adenine glycosylase